MAYADAAEANKWLDENKIKFADDADAAKEGAAAERIIRAKLQDRFGDTNVDAWATNTPELIKTVAAMLMAAFRYQKKYSEIAAGVSDYAAGLKRDAMDLLNEIREGKMELTDVTYVSSMAIRQDDFWPNDTTVVEGTLDSDRKFTMDKVF